MLDTATPAGNPSTGKRSLTEEVVEEAAQYGAIGKASFVSGKPDGDTDGGPDLKRDRAKARAEAH